jgi:hypothetical protein
MEVKFDDEDLDLLLMCSLPTSYNNFRDTILYSHDELTMAEVYEALTPKENMRQMVNSEDDVGSSEEALNVRGCTEQKSLTQVAREKEIKRVAPSQRDHPVICFANIARRKIIILRIVVNCRTRRRGTTC